MELSELANLIKGRRSIRVWKDKDVPEGLLLQAVELATWAPNGGNFQNWHFYIIKNRDVINSVTNAIQSTFSYITDLPEASVLGEMRVVMAQRAGMLRNAPALIAVTAKPYQTPIDQILVSRENFDSRVAEMRRSYLTVDGRIQSVAAAIAYLLLVLHQMDLGALWMTGPLLAKSELEKILKVPGGSDLVALIPVGYPDETPVKDRKPVSEVSEVIR
jgi:nitroreductase